MHRRLMIALFASALAFAPMAEAKKGKKAKAEKSGGPVKNWPSKPPKEGGKK